MANSVPRLQLLAAAVNPRMLHDPRLPRTTRESVFKNIASMARERFSTQQADGTIRFSLTLRDIKKLEPIDVFAIRYFVNQRIGPIDVRLKYAAAAGQTDLIRPLIEEYDRSIRNRPEPIIDVIPIIIAAKEAARKGHVNVIRALPIDRISDKDLGRVVRVAAKNGHAAVLRALPLGRVPGMFMVEAVEEAAKNGHAAALRALPQDAVTLLHMGSLAKQAVDRGDLEVLKALSLNRLDDYDSGMLAQWAAENGHEEILISLRLDRLRNINLGLLAMWAAQNDHEDVLRHLRLDQLEGDLLSEIVAIVAKKGHVAILKNLPLEKMSASNLLSIYHNGSDEIKNIIDPILQSKMPVMVYATATSAVAGKFVGKGK